jgi:membrane protein
MKGPTTVESSPRRHPEVVPPEQTTTRRFREFLGRVLSKADEDNIFFMAGAITFNLLVAVVPLTLLFIGISGFVLSSRFPDPASVLIPFILGNLPSVGVGVDLAVEDRASFSLVGLLVFFWISTRFVATLRTALREIFDIPHPRGIIQGKLFDLVIVVVGGLLFVLNLGITVGLETVEEFGLTAAGIEGPGLDVVRQGIAQLMAFVFIWTLFLLVYRVLPPRRIPWRTALTAATFTGVLFEGTKYLLSWYVTSGADFRTTYGSLTGLAILFFWTYYGAVVFILGGEVAQVLTVNRTRKRHAATPLTRSGE